MGGEAAGRLGEERRTAPDGVGEHGASQPDAGQFYGLLQFTCGLPMPALPDPNAPAMSRAVTVGDVRERRRSLRSWLLPPADGFRLDGLTDLLLAPGSSGPAAGSATLADRTVIPPHTWLLQLSRHAAVPLTDYSRGKRDDQPLAGLPPALDWHSPDGDAEAPWTHYLRVQRARDDSNQRFTSETDCNDYLIMSASKPAIEPGSLWELQLFFCKFLAQRRGAIFASHVSERIYSIWLPPGVITRDQDEQHPAEGSCFAVLPVVTVVRRPYRTDWRYAMSMSALFVPWWPAGPDGSTATSQPRSMSPGEIVDVISATGGNSTYLREPASLTWLLSDESPLLGYLKEITSDERRDFCWRYGRQGGQAGGTAVPGTGSGVPGSWGRQTLRHWIELLLMTVAELPRGQAEREDDRLPEQQRADDRILPDEVLRCLRVNGIWSAMLVTESLAPCAGNSRIVENRWWPATAETSPRTVDELTAGLPTALRTVFDLFAARDRAFAPTPDDRIDVLATGGRAHMTWRIPRERIMITAYSLAADNFPSFSSLYLVGWFAFMAVGVTCAWQTMYSLTHDTDRLQDVADLSQLGHDRIMDLEDVYEFDVAWPAYADFYRHVRELLGVDREYGEIKDRLELLFRFAQAEQRTREERLRDEEISLRAKEQVRSNTRTHIVEIAAAVVGGAILLVSSVNLLVDAESHQNAAAKAVAIISIVVIAIGSVGFPILRSRVRKVDREQEKLRARLAQLTRSSGPASRSPKP